MSHLSDNPDDEVKSPQEEERDETQAEELTTLQKHVQFFDRDGDGIITPYDTYDGFYRLGFGFFLSVLAAILINSAFSLVTRPGRWPDLWFRIYTANIHKALHGSDQEVYTRKGTFRQEAFDELFNLYDHDNKGGLTLREIFQMTQESTDAFDLFGWLANKGEWLATWYVAKDENGVLTKDAIHGMYDGSLFYQLEKERSSSKEKHHRD